MIANNIQVMNDKNYSLAVPAIYYNFNSRFGFQYASI
jgi:hypothetical protein